MADCLAASSGKKMAAWTAESMAAKSVVWMENLKVEKTAESMGYGSAVLSARTRAVTTAVH